MGIGVKIGTHSANPSYNLVFKFSIPKAWGPSRFGEERRYPKKEGSSAEKPSLIILCR
jgi:hypothetical protein